MSCRTLTNITKTDCDSNRGGLYTKVWAFKRSLLGTMQVDSEGSDSSAENDGVITLGWTGSTTPTQDLVTLNFRKQSSGLTSEGTIDDANGISFVTSNLALVFARQNIQKRMAVQTLALQEDLALIVRDANGVNYFLGYNDSVTATAFGAATGTASTDANQYTITLTDISNELPFIVTDANMITLFGQSWKDTDYPIA